MTVQKLSYPSKENAVQEKINEIIDNLGGGGSVDIDNLSITKNSSDKLQAVGLINKNNASGATNPKYDWVGTLQEYETQQVETLHPDWICFITDDVQGGSSVYTKNQVNSLLNVKANSADVYTKTETDTALSSAISTMLGNVYPVGSIYIGTTSTCPIASLISGSTWTIVDSSIVTSVSIPSSIPVYGNGKTLGLTNGTNYTALNGNTNGYVQNRTNGYGTQISSSQADGSILSGRLGITSDTSGNSGIVAKSDNITKTSLTVNIWQRTA